MFAKTSTETAKTKIPELKEGTPVEVKKKYERIFKGGTKVELTVEEKGKLRKQDPNFSSKLPICILN